MSKRLCAVFAVILFAGALNFLAAAPAANDKPQTFKGVVTLLCAAPPAAGSAAATAAPAGDACRWTLLTPADKKVYVLNPQERVAKFSKKTVTVTGTVSTAAKTKMATIDGVVEASTIQVATISPASGS
jgi:hypothetical protein